MGEQRTLEMPMGFDQWQQEDKDIFWIEQALRLAQRAESEGEIPVGAVVVKDDQMIAEGWNQTIQLNDPTAHAEVMALKAAGQSLQNYRLIDCVLYVTLEPCPMCAASLVHARVKRLVYGAYDLKTGAISSVMQLTEHVSMNHRIETVGGIQKEICGERLSSFFKKRRIEQKNKKS